jgi:hypothetical protein
VFGVRARTAERLEQQRLLPRRAPHVLPQPQRARAARALQRLVVAAAAAAAAVRRCAAMGKQRRTLLLLLLARRRSRAARARQLRHPRMRVRWQETKRGSGGSGGSEC